MKMILISVVGCTFMFMSLAERTLIARDNEKKREVSLRPLFIRPRRYILSAYKWDGNIITYRIINIPSEKDGHPLITVSELSSVVRKAFDTWANVSDLTFVEVNETPDIDLKFQPSLKHDRSTLTPAYDSDVWGNDTGTIYLNDNIRWSGTEISWMNNSDDQAGHTGRSSKARSYSLLFTLIHEIGHMLGLSHSSNTSSIMSAVYSRHLLTGPPKLGADDIDAIQNLYGVKRITNSALTEPIPTSASRPTTQISTTADATTQKAIQASWNGYSELLIYAFIILFIALLLFFASMTARQQLQYRSVLNLHKQFISSSFHPDAQSMQIDSNVTLNSQIKNLHYDYGFEINRKNLKIEEKSLGEGEYGKVFQGQLLLTTKHRNQTESTPRPVAVKVPRNGFNVNHQQSLIDELKIMVAVGRHANVLSLEGAITKLMKRGQLFVITEFCAEGNLLNYLHKHRECFINEVRVNYELRDTYFVKEFTYESAHDSEWAEKMNLQRLEGSILSTSDLFSFAFQTANGMDYLSRKWLIHRDLACRNLLLTDRRIVKIADYGLARKEVDYFMDERSKIVPLPVKWMAVEAIRDRHFSTKSDIWSFGVVLWELFTLGKVPYGGIEFDKSFLAMLESGTRLERPENITDTLWELMQRCWHGNPDQRPYFHACRNIIGRELTTCSPEFFDSFCETLRQISELLTGDSPVEENEPEHENEVLISQRQNNAANCYDTNHIEMRQIP